MTVCCSAVAVDSWELQAVVAEWAARRIHPTAEHKDFGTDIVAVVVACTVHRVSGMGKKGSRRGTDCTDEHKAPVEMIEEHSQRRADKH